MKTFRMRSRLWGAALCCSFVLASSHCARADDENLLLGNPSKAKPLPIAGAGVAGVAPDNDNFLVEKPEYSLAYNRKNGGPNWVSWHLAQSDRGRSGRSNDFRPDLSLPTDCQVSPSAYRGSGYDRGHQCPSGDRTSASETNSTTFLMSNMLPQSPDLNRVVWNKLEEYCRDQIKQGANEEYIICGGVGSKSTIADGSVNVPAQCWKIVVFLPSGDNDLARITPQTRVLAVLMPNDDGALAGKTWRDFLVSVDAVEEATGYDFLSNLPKAKQDVLEAKVDTGRAPSARGGEDGE